MNKHIFTDRIIQLLASLFIGKNRFFANSIESPAIKDILNRVKLEKTPIEAGRHEVQASTPQGFIDPAYYVFQMKGKNFPTIIYHHGNNERPFDFGKFSKNSFKDIFYKKAKELNANIIIVRAPFHNSTLKEYQAKISRMANFTAMLSTSVVLIESLIHQLETDGFSEPVAVSGISLGGWATNLHRAYYNTAGIYIPMLAGAALGDLFLTSTYRKMAAKITHENPSKIRSILNFEDDFDKAKGKNVFPLLGKYDQYIQYDVQKGCYGNSNRINVLERGHVTSLTDSSKLLEHILNTMNLSQNNYEF
ncbi:MAG: alpha/beta hydrolase family protein [Bacteroidales bacterium]|nr:alpha/beta hydrolase family protein [Bacteroidales bacterium]MCF8326735.1 alpha/beta hydrolase family protein [Bacteroidales bacterium]